MFLTPTHFSGLNPSTSSRKTLLCETESPLGSIRNFRMVPRVEPRNKTVRFLWGPASVSTTMAVSWYLQTTRSANHIDERRRFFSFKAHGGYEQNSLCVPSHSFDHPGSVPEQRDSLIHQRVSLDKVQHLIRQRGGGAKSGSLHWTSTRSAEATEKQSETEKRKKMERHKRQTSGGRKNKGDRSIFLFFCSYWRLY